MKTSASRKPKDDNYSKKHVDFGVVLCSFLKNCHVGVASSLLPYAYVTINYSPSLSGSGLGSESDRDEIRNLTDRINHLDPIRSDIQNIDAM